MVSRDRLEESVIEHTIVLLGIHHLDLAEREPMPWFINPPALGNLRENAVSTGIQERAQILRPVRLMLDNIQRTRKHARAQRRQKIGSEGRRTRRRRENPRRSRWRGDGGAWRV